MKWIAISLFGLAATIFGLGHLEHRQAERRWVQIPLLSRQVQDTESKVREVGRLRESLMRPVEAPARGENLTAEQVLSGVDALRTILTAFPRQRIPELQLLKDEDWILVAAKLPIDPTEDQLRDALKDLQRKGKEAFVSQGQRALRMYVKKSDGKLPEAVGDLEPYFDSTVPRAVFDRYQITAPGTDPKLRFRSQYPVGGKDSSVEGEWDETVVIFGTNGSGSYPLHPAPPNGKRSE